MRIALGCTTDTEAELVGFVTFIRSIDAEALGAFVVPALDADATRRRVAELFPAGDGPAVEPVHEYLERGHDQVALVDDDPAVRGRQAADAARGAGSASPSPPQVVAWLARHAARCIRSEPELRASAPGASVSTVGLDRLVLRTRWGANLIAVSSSLVEGGLVLDGLYAPELARVLLEIVEPGDTVVDASAGIGAFTIHLGRIVGRHGRVLAIETDAAELDLLQENLRLNGLGGEVCAAPDWRAVDDLVANGSRIALIRAGAMLDLGSLLERSGRAIQSDLVRRLLFRLEPARTPRHTEFVADALGALRRSSGATFAIVTPSGRTIPVTVQQLLDGTEPNWVLADLAAR